MIGAGGGGFLMFYAEDKARLRDAMREAGLTEVRFRFDFEGTKSSPNSMFPVASARGRRRRSRLRPGTEKLPKALLEVAGEPFIVHQLKLLHRKAFDEVVLCVGHLGEQIEKFVGDGRQFGLQISL